LSIARTSGGMRARPVRPRRSAGGLRPGQHEGRHRRLRSRSRTPIAPLARGQRVYGTNRALDEAFDASRGHSGRWHRELAIAESISVGELRIGSLGATISPLNRTKQPFLEAVGLLVIQLLIRATQPGERFAEIIRR